MNKKLKKMLATVSAVAMCAISAIPFGVSASDNPLFDRIMDSFEKQGAFINDGLGEYDLIVTENDAFLLSEGKDTSVTLKKRTYLPVEEINDKISPAQLVKYGEDLTNPDAPIPYSIWFNKGIDNQKVIDIISAYDNVLSIDTEYTVRRLENYLWYCSAVYFKTDLNCEELFPDYDISDVSGVVGYFYQDLTGYKGIKFSSKEELYPVLKTIQDNNIDYKLDMIWCEPVPPVYAEETVNLYTSPDYNLNNNIDINSPEPTLLGDANEDGEVSLADAVLIMQALSNPDDFQLTPQGMANADIVGDGDGITTMDALKIQEMQIGL